MKADIHRECVVWAYLSYKVGFIDICPIYGPKSIIFGAYAQIWEYSISLITQPIFMPLDKTYINVFRRFVATSRAHQSMVLSFLR